MPTLARILSQSSGKSPAKELSIGHSISRTSAKRSCTSFTQRRRMFPSRGAQLNGSSTSPPFKRAC